MKVSRVWITGKKARFDLWVTRGPKGWVGGLEVTDWEEAYGLATVATSGGGGALWVGPGLR